jgi:peptidoglycan hydrolase-like protein with peptidoglycan-binding domain
MNRLKHSPLFLFLTIIAFATSCSQKNGSTEVNPITFDSISVDCSSHLFDIEKNPACNLKLKFIYPEEYTDAKILKKIQSAFVNQYFGEDFSDLSPLKAIKTYEEEYIKNYKKLEPDYLAEIERAKKNNHSVGSWFNYYETSYNEILFNKQNIISTSVYFENYTGGAHGAHAQKNHVIDLNTGAPITESMIFVTDYQNTLTQLIIATIAKNNKAKDIKELENMGYFAIDEIYPNNNFWLNDKGITYTYNEYEIAAYVVGRTHVFIPYNELSLILKPESPISSLINN